MVKGEGVRVVDKEGKGYLDMVAGITRPVHIGFGREEVARAAYNQMCRLHLIITKEDINEAVEVLDQCISEEEKDMGF